MPLSTEDLRALLFLNRMEQGATPNVARALLMDGDSPAALLSRMSGESSPRSAEVVKTAHTFDAAKEMETCEEMGVTILTWWDEKYPACLREIALPPLVLYMKGKILEEDGPALAVVGTRYPSYYGISQTRKFAAELAGAGVTIVSGLARGIDQTAHQAALEVPYGRTLAVLGCGLDVPYPNHRAKFEHTVPERGAFISEYALGTPPLPENFPKRNRIIAGLSLGVLVIEAHEKSGSLITAREALEQGKDIFAIPGPVDRYTSQGSNRLIRQGAYLAASSSDILEVLRISLPAAKTSISDLPDIQTEERLEIRAESGLSPEQCRLLDLLKEKGPLSAAEIAETGVLGVKDVIGLIGLLELAGYVGKKGDGRYTLLNKFT